MATHSSVRAKLVLIPCSEIIFSTSCVSIISSSSFLICSVLSHSFFLSIWFLLFYLYFILSSFHPFFNSSPSFLCLFQGTNPASASMCGMKVVVVNSDENGNIDLTDLKAKALKHKDTLVRLLFLHFYHIRSFLIYHLTFLLFIICIPFPSLPFNPLYLFLIMY